jgi:uncharacterized RDD family membrane protein YckC
VTTDGRVGVKALPDVVPAEARHLQGRRAGLVSRLVANLYDLVVVLLVLVAIYVGWCAVLLLWHRRRFTFPTPSFAQAFVTGCLVLILYFTIAWITSGRTYGDRFMGLRVVGRTGGRLRTGMAFLRAVLCCLFPVGLLWAGVSRQNRSVQDLVLRTSVPYEWLDRSEVVPLAPEGGGSGDDALGVGVDVAAAVADEPDDRHPEPLAGLDREG